MMGDAPETIWAWHFLPEKQNDVMLGGWHSKPSRGDTEYRRADIPATDAQNVLESVAAALWKAQVTGAGSPPGLVRRRTPEAFAEAGDETRNKWLRYARAALAALETE